MRLALLALALLVAAPALAEEKIDEVAALTLEKAQLQAALATSEKLRADAALADVQAQIVARYSLDLKAGDGLDLAKRLIVRAVPKPMTITSGAESARMVPSATKSPAKPAKVKP